MATLTHEVLLDKVFIRGNLKGIKLENYQMCKFPSKRDAERFVDKIFLNIAMGKLNYAVTRATIQEIV